MKIWQSNFLSERGRKGAGCVEPWNLLVKLRSIVSHGPTVGISNWECCWKEKIKAILLHVNSWKTMKIWQSNFLSERGRKGAGCVEPWNLLVKLRSVVSHGPTVGISNGEHRWKEEIKAVLLHTNSCKTMKIWGSGFFSVTNCTRRLNVNCGWAGLNPIYWKTPGLEARKRHRRCCTSGRITKPTY